MSPFLFIILLICVYSLFLLDSLANGLPILFIFWKKQLEVLLISFYFFLFSISFISALILIFFLLLILDSVCPFSTSSSCMIRLYIWDHSCFLMGWLPLWTSLWNLLLLHPISFECCVSIFFCFKVLYISPLISSLIHWFPRRVFFNFHFSQILQFSFSYWFLASYCYGQRRYLIWFQSLWIC